MKSRPRPLAFKNPRHPLPLVSLAKIMSRKGVIVPSLLFKSNCGERICLSCDSNFRASTVQRTTSCPEAPVTCKGPERGPEAPEVEDVMGVMGAVTGVRGEVEGHELFDVSS
mmetsp:Transcript_138538/g.196105  ORF Transcript_138538/g.196105 Transcript_138538/m.196105 type:complete len:112 (-) Transcript_138538:723-1058(-)